MKIQKVPIGKIKSNPENPRIIKDDKFKKLCKSLKEFPEMLKLREVVVDENMVVLGGNMRLKALQEIGVKEVYIKIAEGLSEEQKREFVIKDNAGFGEWDMDLLANEWGDLPLDDWGLDLPDDFFSSDEEKDEKEDDVPPVPETPVSMLGDLWILGSHRLLCGDSTKIEDVERLMDGEKADMVFTDPPYGIDVVQGSQVGGGGKTKFGKVEGENIVESKTYKKIKGDETTETAEKFYKTCLELNMKNIVLWGGNYFTGFLSPSRCWFVWDKEMTGNFSEAEMAWTSFEKGGIRVFKFLWNGLSREGNRKDELKGRVHPTQKPVGLFANIFKRFDYLKTIYDGFVGSGSTLIACEKTNRKCYGMELDEHYVDVIIKRWEEYSGNKAKHETGLSFEQTEKERNK